MGRHAANRPAPESGDAAAQRVPLHADLFAPSPGTAAARAAEERTTAMFDSLVAPHRAGLRAYVLRLTGGDEAGADSVLKETLYRAAQDPARYPQTESAVRPWLVLTARMVLRDADPPPREPVRRSTTVLRALDDLSDVHREILVELFYRGVSLEDAADDRGVPVETVKSRLYYAMRALRVVLDQQIGDPGPDVSAGESAKWDPPPPAP
jgi:RNA polymerase sigma-70 factor (ECF subfamily)